MIRERKLYFGVKTNIFIFKQIEKGIGKNKMYYLYPDILENDLDIRSESYIWYWDIFLQSLGRANISELNQEILLIDPSIKLENGLLYLATKNHNDIYSINIALDKLCAMTFSSKDLDQSYEVLKHSIIREENTIYIFQKALLSITNFLPIEFYVDGVKTKSIGGNILQISFKNEYSLIYAMSIYAYAHSILVALEKYTPEPNTSNIDLRKALDKIMQTKKFESEAVKAEINLKPINNTKMVKDEERLAKVDDPRCGDSVSNVKIAGSITPMNPFGNMFGNMGNMFQGMNIEMGAINDSSIAVSPKGICFFNADTQTYKAWDSNNKELVDVGGMAMQGMFMKMPVDRNKLKEGDILIINGEYRIFDGFAQKTMKLINPLTGVQTNKQKETNLLNLTFFTKVICPFNPFSSTGKGGKMFQTMAIMQMMGGGMQGGDMMSQLMQMQLMSSMFGGDGAFDMDFSNLFSGFGDEEDDSEDKAIKKATKKPKKEDSKKLLSEDASNED